jgi:hypothetical protein
MKDNSLHAYGLSSSIPALIPQSLLIRPGEVPMPRKEVALENSSVTTNTGDVFVTHGSMNSERVLDMDGNKVVVSGLCSRVLCCGKLGWLLNKA